MNQAIFSMNHVPFSMNHATFSMNHATFSMNHATLSMNHETFVKELNFTCSIQGSCRFWKTGKKFGNEQKF